MLGLIGGGIGQLLFDLLNTFAYDSLAAIIVVIAVAVFGIDDVLPGDPKPAPVEATRRRHKLFDPAWDRHGTVREHVQTVVPSPSLMGHRRGI